MISGSGIRASGKVVRPSSFRMVEASEHLGWLEGQCMFRIDAGAGANEA